MQSTPDPAQTSHVITAQITHTINHRNNTPNHLSLAHHQENWANPEHSLSPTLQNDLFMCEVVENTLPPPEPTSGHSSEHATVLVQHEKEIIDETFCDANDQPPQGEDIQLA
ncbi:hypothetical protein S245_005170 [Arachis hypogaea]